MADPNLNDIYKTLGNLEATVSGINDKLDRADVSRAKVHDRLDGFHRDLSKVQSDLAGMRSDVADSKTVTDDVKRWRLMGMGALAIVGVGGTAFGAAIVTALEPIAKFLKH